MTGVSEGSQQRGSLKYEVYKTFLTHPDTARDFLALYLPPALLKICDLNTLKLESGSFIEEGLHPYFADVLWSLKTANGEGYIYALIEHQSTPDRHMAFRLLRYAIAAMQRHLDAGHERLPLVVPILFCHGRATPWPYTLNWLELFNEPEVARQLYSASFPLVDVGALDDDDIMKHKRMAMLELLLKHSHIRDLMAVIEPLVCLLEEGYTTQARLTALMNWMLHTANTVEPVAFVKELAHRMPQHREEFMTIAQALEQIGLERGLQQGLAKGLEQGRQEAMQDVARRLLGRGLSLEVIAEATGLSEQVLRQIRQ